MRICHIITRLIIGGAQENTVLSCEGLHGRGHEVTLISGPTNGPEGALTDRARRGGYRFIECPPLRRNVHPWHDLAALLDLQKLLRDIRPDVVHTHSSKAGILGRIAARRTGVSLIVHTIHGMSFNRTQRTPTRVAYRTLERYCGAFTHRFVSVCDAMTDQAVAARLAPRERFTTIYSGIEVDTFDPKQHDRDAVRAAWGAAPNDVVVGAVARLFRNKGYEDLIPAMGLAAQREPRLRFVWIGDGHQRDEYVGRVRQLGLGDRLTLTGLVPPHEIPRLLSGIDLLAHASRWEGLPRAVVQALLMEKPAVSFDIDGAPEVVLDGVTGRLAPLGDVAAFSAAMVHLAADTDRRATMGREGRLRCLDRFDHRNMVARLEALYQRSDDAMS